MSCKYNNCKHCGYKSECEIFKENAELKEELVEWNLIREDCETAFFRRDYLAMHKRVAKAKEIIRELSKSLFLAKGLIRDLCDDTVDFIESKERALYCYNQKHLDGYEKAEDLLKE